nr:MAG TPA: hypothetical protein [Caudoviricetes sp.]
MSISSTILISCLYHGSVFILHSIYIAQTFARIIRNFTIWILSNQTRYIISITIKFITYTRHSISSNAIV